MEAGGGRVVVRDSAGVRIVESRAPQWGPGDGWRLSDEPVLDVGQDQALYRVGTALRLAGGRIVVAHGSENELLFFPPAGGAPARVGGTGSGPGEFREISRLFLFAPDSLLVYDLPQLRASVFDTLGRLVRTFSPPTPVQDRPSFVAGAFSDGSLLIEALNVPTPDARGLLRPPRSLWRSGEDAEMPVFLGELPGQERFYQDSPWGPVDFRRPFFGHASSYATSRDRLYFAATDTFEVRVLDRDGRLLSILRKEHDYSPVSAADVAPLIDRQLASVTDENARRQARRMLENLPVGGHTPAFGWPVWADSHGPELQLDDVGNLWVVEYVMPGTPRNARTVFDSTGAWLGTVELPDRFAPTHIGPDFVLGTWTDSLDVEHVRLYALIKP